MAVIDSLLGPLSRIIDKVIPDPVTRGKAKAELLSLEHTRELETLKANLSAVIAEANSADPWTSRARPSFLYVMYIMLIWAIPMGIIGAFNPNLAQAISQSMTGYLQGIPESLYALFGTGYLGYSAMRQWGKSKGSDR